MTHFSAFSSQVRSEFRSKPAMLRWALIFLVVAIVAGVFGMSGIASASASIAQILFVVFLILFAISLVAGLTQARSPRL